MKNLHFIIQSCFEGDKKSYFTVGGLMPMDEGLFSDKQREKFMQNVYLFAYSELETLNKSLNEEREVYE